MLTPGEVAAICYGDIFDFPLTQKELSTFKITNSSKKFLSNKITLKDGYHFLSGRGRLIQLRKKRESYSREKMHSAKRICSLLRFVPTIQMIAVTGALAMNNCDRDDDIDLLIVSKTGCVWMTRFFCIILLEVLGKRRRPLDTYSSNKICMNMFLDEDHLKVPKKEQDIFSAHEAAQIKILWSRGEVEQKYWQQNRWIKKFLPNTQIKNYSGLDTEESQASNWFEGLFRHIQLQYMNSKRTTEVIQEGYLRFHPKDARNWVIPEYEKRLAMIRLK